MNRIIALGLVALLSIAVAACGSSSDPVKPVTVTQQAPAPAAPVKSEPAPEPTTYSAKDPAVVSDVTHTMQKKLNDIMRKQDPYAAHYTVACFAIDKTHLSCHGENDDDSTDATNTTVVLNPDTGDWASGNGGG